MKRRAWKTTEFWVSVATTIGVVASAVAGVVSAPVAATLVAVSTGAFAIARGVAKVNGE